MLWHCFSFTSLHFLTTPSVGLLPLPQDCESTMVRGKAPLDPPYLSPSGQGGLSQPEAAQWEEREGETCVCCLFPVLTPWREDSSCSPPVWKDTPQPWDSNSVCECVPEYSACAQTSLLDTITHCLYLFYLSYTHGLLSDFFPLNLPNTLLPRISHKAVCVCERQINWKRRF